MPSESNRRNKVDNGVWTLDELGELWRHVHGKYYEPAFLVAAFGGCRVGESLGVLSDEVRKSCIDGIDLAIVPIVRQVTHGRDVVDRLKTRNSVRDAAIPGKAAHTILSYAEENAGTYLSTNGVGGFVNHNRLNYGWKKDVPKDLWHPFRNLRNSWQTNMRWELGVPPWLIEPVMGHVGEGVTGRHYDRPQTEVFCETVAKAYASNPYDAH